MTDEKDDLEQAASTLDGTRDKNESATRDLKDASDQAVENVGAAQRVEAQRDAQAEDHAESLRSVQSYLDQQGNALSGIGANLKALYDQVLMDRRAFLAGMAVFGAAYADKTNLFPTDGSYDPLPGQENNSEEPHDDWDAWGLSGEQGFEPHQAAEGSSGGAQYPTINESIDREAYEDIFNNIIKEDRAMAQQIMSPDVFDRYFDGEATEFAKMEVNYRPDPNEPANSKIQIGIVQADRVEDLSHIPDEEISYSGWQNISDRVAQALVQELEAYETGTGGYSQ